MSCSIVKLEHINYSIAHQPILQDVCLQLFEGDFAALIGPNGGGKTTLFNIILGLTKADSGSVGLFEQSAKKNRMSISYMPQFANFPRNFPLSVFNTVLQGSRRFPKWYQRISAEDKSMAEKALKEMQLWEYRNHPIGRLSGGQLQRALIARAIVGEPELLLLDEPTANIDERSERDIFDLFKELNKRMTIMVISHDIGFISEYVNRVFCLNKTLMTHQSEKIDGDLIEQLYGEHIHAVHHHSKHCDHSSPYK